MIIYKSKILIFSTGSTLNRNIFQILNIFNNNVESRKKTCSNILYDLSIII